MNRTGEEMDVDEVRAFCLPRDAEQLRALAVLIEINK